MSAGFLDSISPWASRTSTPKPGQVKGDKIDEKLSAGNINKQQQGGDHRISHRHRLSLKNYPEDCPSLSIRWFYAVDVRFLDLRALNCCIDTGSHRYRKENHHRFTSPLNLSNHFLRRRNSSLSPLVTLALSNQHSKGLLKRKSPLERERMSQAT